MSRSPVAGYRSPESIPTLSVLSVASEAYPLIKTGGLADVVGALPAALAAQRVRVVTLLPGYPAVLATLAAAATHRIGEIFGGPARLLAGHAAGLDLLVLDAPHLYDRPGNPYTGPDRRDWPDNAQRFAALGLAASHIARGALPGFRPDVLHAHDWQAGLAPAYLHYAGAAVPSVFTVHNLAFQGWFPANLLQPLELPRESFAMEGVEYYGGIGFLKSGLYFATAITTVSPTYAAEIRTQPGGMGLDGLLRSRAAVLHGIVNGIDTREWDPEHDPRIAARFGATTLDYRRQNKAALQTEFGLATDAAAPLFGAITRLTHQKGSDLLLQALPMLLDAGAQFVLLGSGDAELEAGFAHVQAAHPGRIGVRIGYDESLAHHIQAGADAILVPSRFEPCGLTQLCGLRYGAVPVVGAVGGLADTVTNATPETLAAGTATGFQFAPVQAAPLLAALQRALSVFRERPAWKRLQLAGMTRDVSWQAPAHAYAALCRSLLRSSNS